MMHPNNALNPSKTPAGKHPKQDSWVRETRFGRWFLSTHTWYRYVLSQAVIDFKQLLNGRAPEQGRILDAGCGEGLAFQLLEKYFNPKQIVGIEIDREQVVKAQLLAAGLATSSSVIHGNACSSELESASFDIVFCHQLLHHTSQQSAALQEFYRLLKPGGLLLVGESCRSFIQSAPVRLLFRHPHMSQQNAQGYIDLVRSAGFLFSAEDVQTSRPWWSRRSLGLAQKCGLGKNNTEPTEILIAARKPEIAAGKPE